ncbi:hypothetical protein ACM66B_000807 [Microbotryomycetes sp. NB124-2]
MTTDEALLRPTLSSQSTQHERASSITSIKSNSSSLGPMSPALSEASSSSRLSRRSSLSHNRNRSSLNASGRTAAPAFMYLPPGTSTCQEVDDDGVDPSHPVSLARLDPTGGVCVATTAPSSSERARRLSSSSSVASASGTQSDLLSTELVSSPPSSVGEQPPLLPPPPPVPTKQTQLVLDSIRKPSMAKERAPGEDPELAAARRALWEDEPEHQDSTKLSSVFDEEDEDAVQKTPTAATRILSFERQVAPPAPGSEVSDYEERLEFVEPPNLDEGDEDEDRPPPSTPGHATLPPLPPCLRPKSVSRRHSGTSSSGTTISVRISEDPPASFPTYSPIDYERKGDEPVSRLSVREWLELQGVREAVGVWSGRIEKPDDQALSEMESNAASGNGTGTVATSKETAPAKANGYTALSDSVSSLASQDDEKVTKTNDLRSRGGLAAIVGVVTVGHNSTPVTAPKSLFD